MDSTRAGASPHGSRLDILAVGHAPMLRISRRIYSALGRLGWEVELAVPRALSNVIGNLEVESAAADDPVIHALDLQGGYSRTWSFAGLDELLQKRAPRLVYLENEPDSLIAGKIGRWCAKNDSKLVVNTNENDVPPVIEALVTRGLKPALRSLRTRLWLLLNGRYVAHVVAISELGREAMHAVGFHGRVTVTPLGFEPAIFRPDPESREKFRRKLGLDKPVIAYFGRLAPNKGVHILIAALGRIHHLEYQFLIDDFAHASADYHRLLQRAIDDAGLAERTVSFTASHEEMPSYMRAADIVAVPSTWREQYGRVAPEAMACGCCVVVSRIGALPELVGDSGIAVEPGDVDALASALAGLLNAPERRAALSQGAAERARNLLSLDRQAQLLDGLFHKLVG